VGKRGDGGGDAGRLRLDRQHQSFDGADHQQPRQRRLHHQGPRLRHPGDHAGQPRPAGFGGSCSADGWRPTSYSLDATADGWIWGNSALVVVTGGAAVLGLLVDESRDAGMVYSETVNYELDRDRPRTVFTSDRVNGIDTTLQTR